MIWMIVAILVALGLATYLSALNLALINLSRAALQRKLHDKGTPAAGDWLHDQQHAAILATALIRTLMRMAIYIFMLAALVNLHTQATVTWTDLIVSGLLAAIGIWFSTIVFGSAIARHCGISLVAASLPVLLAITVVCRPFTKAGELIDAIFQKLIGRRDPEALEQEFLQTIEDSHREGALDVQSAEILENVVEFTNKEVSQVMTPRAEIEGIEYTDDLAAVREFILHAGHSRIPVYQSTVDNIVGILYLKDLIKYLGEETDVFKLSEHLRQPIVVPETKPVRELLSVFQHGEVHLAIVVDEFGGTAGLVTIEDVLEEIVGDIRDEHEPHEADRPTFKSIDDTHAEVDGRYRIDELNTRLHLDIPENGDFDTVAGFMLSHFGRVPSPGEAFDAGNARFTALAATPTHVQRVGIELLQSATANGERWEQAAK
jgi:putative hemolysin